MADITRTYRWEKFAPDLGNNLDLPEDKRFNLEIASGLPPARLVQFEEDIGKAAKADNVVESAVLYTAAMEGLVRVVGENTIAGIQVNTLKDYVALLMGTPETSVDLFNLIEVTVALREFNSLTGQARLFWRRHSGGLLSMPGQSVAKNANQTAGQ